MGLTAQVIGIGPYSPEIAWALEYSDTYYANVERGATVVTNVFIASWTEDSHQMAEAFGFGAFELGKHHIVPANANHERIRQLFSDEELQQFLALAAAGFEFYYLPNG